MKQYPIDRFDRNTAPPPSTSGMLMDAGAGDNRLRVSRLVNEAKSGPVGLTANGKIVAYMIKPEDLPVPSVTRSSQESVESLDILINAAVRARELLDDKGRDRLRRSIRRCLRIVESKR